MIKLSVSFPKLQPLTLLLLGAFCCVGLFQEYLAAFSAVFLIGCLGVLFFKRKRLVFRWNLASVAVCLVVFSYGIGCFWAVDPGMALIGFSKFLPVLLFLLCLMQNPQTKDNVEAYLPYFFALMTVIAAIGMQIPALKDWFSVNGRLSGFLQYPNTFALLLLIAELLLLKNEKLFFPDWLCAGILIAGIFYSGSRTVFVLALVMNLLGIFLIRNKKTRWLLLAILGGVALLTGGFALLTGRFGDLGRFLTLSPESSTFLGRFLYAYDALPVILKHPFGLGYMGYYYLQPSFQTGVYAVMFAHNEFLQLLLDVGWIPALAFFAAFFKPIFQKLTNRYDRLILIAFLLHSLFDFNLQFIAVFFLLLVFITPAQGKEFTLHPPVLCSAGLISLLLCLYCGTAQLLYSLGFREECHTLYPWHTQNQVQRLAETEDLQELSEIADQILARNESVPIALSAKARSAYAKGDFGNVIAYKKELMEKAPFQYSEYEEYCYMLINGISLYQQAGDPSSAEICARELIAARDRLQAIPQRLSPFGRKILDQPQTELPREILDYIAQIKK